MKAREIIEALEKARNELWQIGASEDEHHALWAVRRAITALRKAGCRVLEPGEVTTIQTALQCAREGFVVSGSMPLSDADTVTEIDNAIRALKGTDHG